MTAISEANENRWFRGHGVARLLRFVSGLDACMLEGDLPGAETTGETEQYGNT